VIPTIAIYGGSFNPPGLHHRATVEMLCRHFDEVVIVPCGPRPDKPVTNDVDPIHRAAMVDLSFRGIPKARVELFDLESQTFTRTFDLDRRFQAEGIVWHVVADEFIRGGQHNESIIQSNWTRGNELWNEANFAILNRSGGPLVLADLPRHNRVFTAERHGASLAIRNRAFHREPIADLVVAEVDAYIRRHRLYQGVTSPRQTRFRLNERRYLVVADERNGKSREVSERLAKFSHEDPELIVVIGGDGTMLRAIRQHWRRRLPFFGINTGHLGFLLNDSPQADAHEQDLVFYHLPLLRVEVESIDGRRTGALAFNDAWVERASGQTAWLKLMINDVERIEKLVADGVLVATAAGSTSYARAMGATPLPLYTPALLLVGSNVLHPPQWRPAVLPSDSRIEVRTHDPEKRPLKAFLDGIPQGTVQAIHARVSNIAAVELAFLPDHDPSLKLAKLQFP
jgi:NAD kinase/nicotinic acid mononucleotide adenylyltransferase